MPTVCKNFTGHAVNPKQHTFQQIVIAGGGLAGIFSAYEILQRAKDAGKEVSVLLIADKINAPCTAGSHVVLELEGQFDADEPQSAARFNLLRSGLQGIQDTVARENLDCRLIPGYEVKGKTEEELHALALEMVDKNMYSLNELHPNSEEQVFNLPGNPASLYVDKIGQINVPELLHGLLDKIKEMGGKVMLDTKYLGQTTYPDVGITIVETTNGNFSTPNKPLLATGPEHQKSLPGFDFETEIVHTTGIVIGPLSDEDARRISARPMAFCDTELDGDVLWGGLDDHNMLTIGRGDLKNPTPEQRDALLQDLTSYANELYPGIADKYPVNESYGAMLVPENRMPIVGRMKDYDVAGGWAGMGIVAGYAAAQAYADWIVHGDDTNLKLFEEMQPGKFESTHKQPTPATRRPTADTPAVA